MSMTDIIAGPDAVLRIREKAKAERQAAQATQGRTTVRSEAAKERDCARGRERYRERCREDPEYRARLSAASKARYHEDPDHRDRQAEYKERRRQDQAFVSRESAKQKARYARKKTEGTKP